MENLFFLVSFLLFGVCATEPAKVRFYENYGSKGYYKEVENVGPTCTNLRIPEMPSPITKGTIQTDTCLMIYAFPDCTGGSAKIYPGSYNITRGLFNIFLHKYVEEEKKYGATGIHSIVPCSETLGGRVLNVDVIWSRDERKIELKDVCSCRNLPTHLFDVLLKPRADNHGNDFIKYTQPDCKGEPRLVPAGQNEETEHFYVFGEDKDLLGNYIWRWRPVKSIGPLIVSEYYQKHCVRLTGKITKFVFTDKSEEVNSSEAKFGDVDLTDKTFIRNNGTSKITQEYKVTKKVEEKLELEFVETLTHLFKLGGEMTVEVSGGASIPFLAEGQVKTTLKAVIENTDTKLNTQGRKKTVATTKEYSISQKIEVPSCTETSVWGVVNMVKDRPLEYKVYSEISGEFGDSGKRMTAKELKDNIGKDLDVLEDVDGWTVSTVGKGVVKATYGIKSFVDVQQTRIDGCKK